MQKHYFTKILIIAISPIFALLSAYPSFSETSPAPSNPEILAIISDEFPSHFSLDELVLGEATSSETGGRARFIYRFRLAFSATEPLFSKTREVGPFAIVVPTINRDDVQQITGVLDLVSNGQGWSVGFSIEHDLGDYGRPFNQFGQPVLLSGAPETRSKLEQLRDETQAQALEQIRVEIEAEANEFRSAAAANLEAERIRVSEDIIQIIADHAVKRGALIAEQRQQISTLETGLAIERQNLTRQVASARDVLALQALLDSSLTQIAANDAAAIATFERMRAQRIRLLDALPKQWAGIVLCTDNNKPDRSLSRTLTFEFETVQASGFSGRFNVNNGGRRTDGQVAIQNETLNFPLQLDFSLPNVNTRNDNWLPRSFRLELSASGKMHGAAPFGVTWTGDSASSTLTCVFDISG